MRRNPLALKLYMDMYLAEVAKMSFKRGENMRGYKMLYNVANGIFAAGKIGEVLYKQQGNKRNGIYKTNLLANTCKILDILAQYTPEENREAFGARASKSKLYLETCNNLNRHFSTYAKSFDAEKIAQAFNIIKPILGGDEKRIVDKMLKIYDALV